MFHVKHCPIPPLLFANTETLENTAEDIRTGRLPGDFGKEPYGLIQIQNNGFLRLAARKSVNGLPDCQQTVLQRLFMPQVGNSQTGGTGSAGLATRGNTLPECI